MNENAIITGYIMQTHPVQWIAWDEKLKNVPDWNGFHVILFDEGDNLRDLTESTIRLQVIEYAKECLILRKLILSEVESFVDKVVERADGMKEQ